MSAISTKIATSYGTARVEIDDAGDPALLLVLTHSAGGGVDAPDLMAVRDATRGLCGAVARVLQPYRVCGRRAPGDAARQDAAWLEVIEWLTDRYGDVPLVQGGRSNGARVACRTARAARVRAVIALAFPLHPPGRPERSRVGELREAGVEVLVINGERDPFGVPDPADATHVHVLPGERHGLNKNPAAVGEVAAHWLRRWSTVSDWSMVSGAYLRNDAGGPSGGRSPGRADSPEDDHPNELVPCADWVRPPTWPVGQSGGVER